MNIEKIDILTLIPQRPPMIMVDKLVHYDPVTTRSLFTVGPSTTFVEDGSLLPAGIIENIAQTCAARIGYINRLSNQEVKIGVIGSVENLKVSALPGVGDTLATEINVDATVFNVTIVSATVSCGDKEMARCSMKIAVVD